MGDKGAHSGTCLEWRRGGGAGEGADTVCWPKTPMHVSKRSRETPDRDVTACVRSTSATALQEGWRRHHSILDHRRVFPPSPHGRPVRTRPMWSQVPPPRQGHAGVPGWFLPVSAFAAPSGVQRLFLLQHNREQAEGGDGGGGGPADAPLWSFKAWARTPGKPSLCPPPPPLPCTFLLEGIPGGVCLWRINPEQEGCPRGRGRERPPVMLQWDWDGSARRRLGLWEGRRRTSASTFHNKSSPSLGLSVWPHGP